MKYSKKEREEIIEMIKSLSQKFTELRNQVCLPYELSNIQSVVILDIYHHPGQTKVTDICKRLNKSTNSISPLINRLISKGFLKKTQDTHDGRIFNIELTEKSKSITDSIRVDISDYTLPIFEDLTEEELDQIYSSLKLLNKVVF